MHKAPRMLMRSLVSVMVKEHDITTFEYARKVTYAVYSN